jgi:MoaA/NifB/PqqE/SkfB family radical SAM enzyme
VCAFARHEQETDGRKAGGDVRPMFIQIEITTHCNFTCFYCAGRDMAQKHMSWATFADLLAKLPKGRHTVSLQGEGEPIVHPKFWKMIEAIGARGHIPYTITNGSRLKADLIARHFPQLGISLDTLDETEATRIGRLQLPKVLRNLERLVQTYDPRRIRIHTVDYGQDIEPIKQYLKRLGIRRQLVQPLQRKDDYAYRYPALRPVRLERYTYRCHYIDKPSMKYFNIDGQEFPCCFIKNKANFVSTQHIRESLARREVPASCRGCEMISAPAARPAPR